jgi:hypothetical protein
VTATPQVLNRMNKASVSGILIGYWDEVEYEADTGIPFVSLTPVGRPKT